MESGLSTGTALLFGTQHKRLSGPVFVGCHSGLGLEEFVE